MKTITHSFQGTFIFNLQSNEGNMTTNKNSDKEDGVTKPSSRAFCNGEIFAVQSSVSIFESVPKGRCSSAEVTTLVNQMHSSYHFLKSLTCYYYSIAFMAISSKLML